MDFKSYPKAVNVKRKSRKTERNKVFQYNKKLREMKRKEKRKANEQ